LGYLYHEINDTAIDIEYYDHVTVSIVTDYEKKIVEPKEID